MKYKFILFSPWLLKSPVKEYTLNYSLISKGYWNLKADASGGLLFIDLRA